MTVETYEKTFAGRDRLIAGHRAAGAGVLPASVQLEMAMVAVARRGTFRPLELTDVTFARRLALAGTETGTVRLEATSGGGATGGPATRFTLSTVTESGPQTLASGSGRLLESPLAPPSSWDVDCPTVVAPADLYAGWSAGGLDYGVDFRTVRELSVGDGAAEAVLRATGRSLPWYSHPLLVDGVLQVVSCALQDLAQGARPMLPVGLTRLALLAELARVTKELRVRVRRTSVERAYSVADAIVLADSGEVVAELRGVRMRPMPAAPSSPAPASAAPSAAPASTVPSPAPASGPAPDLMTEIRWTATPAPGAGEPPAGVWVLLHNGDALGGRIAAALRTAGAQVVEVPPETPADESAYRAVWAAAPEPVAGVLHLRGTGPAAPEEVEMDRGVYTCLAALKTLGERQRTARFVVVTEHAQRVLDGEPPVPARAGLWGLVRTAAIEYPGLRPRLVDLDPVSGDAVLAELAEGPVEVAYRDGVRYRPERVPYRPPAPRRPVIRPGGRYLILGGHGGLGIEVAARLAAAGAGAVGLVSRSGGSGVDLARVIRSGCEVASYAADIATPGALAAVVRRFRDAYGHLHGVMHAAGTLRDGLIRSATAEDLAVVLRPKVDGTRELAAAVTGIELDFAVLFGSVSGTFGNLGQGGYAAANAYLDAFAHARQAPWTTIDWGLWGEAGMGTAVAGQLRRRGVVPLGTVEALDALMAALGGDARQLVVAHPTAGHPATVQPAIEQPATVQPATVQPAIERPAAAPAAPPAGGGRTERELARFLAERLGVSHPDRGTPLADYGINSIMSVELAEELSRRWRVSLPATLFLEYAEFGDLADALVERYGAAPPEVAAPEIVPAEIAPAEAGDSGAGPAASVPARQAFRDGDVAVVAVSGDLPGAGNLAELWSMLRSGGDAFTDVPAERWDIDTYYQDRGPDLTGTYCRAGAFLSDVDRFDPRLFGISVREARELDPQQKLLLKHAWSVIDDGGLAGRRDIGVFVGATYTHHRDSQGLAEVGPHTALGSMNAVLANRISYALDLTGPSQTVDTLCSSSLVAVQQAVTALRGRQCAAAVVATCHVGLTPWYYRSLSQLGALSPTRPRPFDEQADGFVPGEGAIAIALKRLEDAERDGDQIWGVIRGVAVNHGGRGSALPVPRSEAQAAVIRSALADASLAAADISLVETHGTATPLGDPIEIAALNEVFAGRTEADPLGPVLLGSVKANIGHLEPASGLAGLVKVLLCMKHGEVPPMAGFTQPNRHIDLTAGALTVPTRVHPWRVAGPRRAGVSAFGMGGTNAHLIIEEHLVDETAGAASPGSAPEQILVLSGHTPGALRQRVSDLAAVLAAPDRPAVAAVCRSAAVGRRHLPHRVAVLGRTADELAAGLRRALDSPDGIAGVASNSFARLAAEYRSGRSLDWQTVYSGPAPRRVALPPYPFLASAPRDWTDACAQVLPAHGVFGQETVPAALLLAMGFATDRLLEKVSFTARGVGSQPVTSTVTGQTTTFRHGGRVIARLAAGTPAGSRPVPIAIDELRQAHPRSLDPAGLYAWFAARDMRYEAPLTALAEVGYGPDSVLARVTTGEADAQVQTVVALDAALQAMAVLTLADPGAPVATYLPVAIGRARQWGDPAGTAYVYLRQTEPGPGGARHGSVRLLSAGGEVLAELDDVVYRPVSGGQSPPLAPHRAAPPDALPAVVSPALPVVDRPAPAGQPVPEEQVVAVVRSVLRDQDITATGALSAAGLDSLLATEVATVLNRDFGAQLTPMDILDVPHCRALAERVAAALPAAVVPGLAAATAVDRAPATAAEPPELAVVGLACALPGAAGPQQLWDMVSHGATAIGPAPQFRWNGAPSAPGGFLERIAEFDARLFDFFPKQAEALDPQVRWLLQTAWEALESAGIPPVGMPAATGVFVGASYQHYKDYHLEPELDAPSGLGNHNAFLANRLSYFLDLTGPSMTIDTLCSSSLVALHTAARSIRDGECDQAIVAGVRLAMSPLHYTAMRNLHALSPTGASRAFADGADGFVPGEGVVTVVVKPLSAAIRDGNRIRAIIKGTAVNHGGRTSGLTVPSGEGQANVVAAALRHAGIDPESIGLLEAHGTGTSLGDPIEIEALTRAWRGFTEQTQFCAIGSLKANIGHLEPAAGLAGLAKVLLAMENGQIPPTLHVSRPNDNIRFEDTPFYVADRATPWPRGMAPRRAAVSAFGMGGVNAHVIVEEPPARPERVAEPVPVAGPEREPVAAPEYTVRVSGATETAVRALAARYADRFTRAAGDWETADLCHTANVGRSRLAYQAVVRGRDAADLASGLRQTAAGGGQVLPADHDRTDWAALSRPGARMTELDTYPFARERYWRSRHHNGSDNGADTGHNGAGAGGGVSVADPEAWRTAWQVRPAAAVAVAQGRTVRVVAAGPGTGERVAAALREAGMDIAAEGEPAQAAVVVNVPPAGGLVQFWHQLRSLVATLPRGGTVVWADQRAAAVRPEERANLDPAAAARAMAVRAACAEHRCPVTVVDLDPADPAERRGRQLAAELAALAARPAGGNVTGGVTGGVTDNVMVAYREGVRFVLEPVRAEPGPPTALSADGYYLVTGGMGAVGRKLIGQLVAGGARRIGIIGRSSVDVASSAVLRDLAQRIEVDYQPGDVSDRAALAAAATRFGQRWGQLRGVVHASGGVNPFGSARRRSWAEAAPVIAPKVAGSENVVRLAQQAGAEFVVLVSSVGGAQPEAGRGLVDYALANAYQLALAERETGAAADGASATVVTAHAWPNWTGVGMEADASFAAAHSVTPAQAVVGFSSQLRSGGAVVFPGVAPATEPGHPPATVPPAALSAASPVPPAGPAVPAPEVAGPPIPEAAAVVRAAFRDVLGADPGEGPLARLGLDSITIADLARALERRSGRTIDMSVLMRAQTTADIAAWLGGRPATQPAATAADSTLSALLRPLVEARRAEGAS